MNQKCRYSQKYQREIALAMVFQYVYYGKFFLPLFLDQYFKCVLNRVIQNFNGYNQKAWNVLYRTDFYVMNYMERSLFLILCGELEEKKISSKLLTFIYIRLAKKYCRKNFYKLIPVFIANAEECIH